MTRSIGRSILIGGIFAVLVSSKQKSLTTAVVLIELIWVAGMGTWAQIYVFKAPMPFYKYVGQKWVVHQSASILFTPERVLAIRSILLTSTIMKRDIWV